MSPVPPGLLAQQELPARLAPRESPESLVQLVRLDLMGHLVLMAHLELRGQLAQAGLLARREQRDRQV